VIIPFTSLRMDRNGYGIKRYYYIPKQGQINKKIVMTPLFSWVGPGGGLVWNLVKTSCLGLKVSYFVVPPARKAA